MAKSSGTIFDGESRPEGRGAGTAPRKTFRSVSVLAALCLGGAAYAQTPLPPNTPSTDVRTPTPNPELDGASTVQRSGEFRMATASPGNVATGMQVKSPAGDVLGTVASIIPGKSSSEGYVVIATPKGAATPVPYSTVSARVRDNAVVLDKARFEGAPKVQQYQKEDGSSTVWEEKADSYWKR
jgi:hypothetical protein